MAPSRYGNIHACSAVPSSSGMEVSALVRGGGHGHGVSLTTTIGLLLGMFLVPGCHSLVYPAIYLLSTKVIITRCFDVNSATIKSSDLLWGCSYKDTPGFVSLLSLYLHRDQRPSDSFGWWWCDILVGFLRTGIGSFRQTGYVHVVPTTQLDKHRSFTCKLSDRPYPIYQNVYPAAQVPSFFL